MSESDVYRQHILVSKVNPLTERIKYLLLLLTSIDQLLHNFGPRTERI